MAEASSTNVQVQNIDYLSLNPLDDKYANVRVVLLDPSCSGSGMNHLVTHNIDNSNSNSNSQKQLNHSNSGDAKVINDVKDTTRLHALADFQLKALLHSMSFPAAERITYSTCSIHDIENENVVAQALTLQTTPAVGSLIGMWELKVSHIYY